MEIRNNTPSFGMAFKKPPKSEIVNFTRYLTDDMKVSSEFVKDGLEKIVKKHSQDKHFDIYFTSPNKISVDTISGRAKQLQNEGWMDANRVDCGESALDKYRKKYFSAEYKETRNNAELFTKIFMSLVKFKDTIKTRVILALKPEEVLPLGIRNASRNVSTWEHQINELLAKELSEQVKNTKKQQLKEARIKKAIDEVSSVFEPKIKTASSKVKPDVKK